MPIFATKMLAAGFAASMAFSGSTKNLTSTIVRQTSQPNAIIFPATSYIGTPAHISFAFPSPLDLWIEKLIVLESNGKEDIKILDHNGEHSFGCLQFQKETFEEFGLKYKLIIPDAELDNLLYDCDLQKEMARKMIEDNYNNWRHWYTSVKIKKLGLPPHQSVQKLCQCVAESRPISSSDNLYRLCRDWCRGLPPKDDL